MKNFALAIALTVGCMPAAALAEFDLAEGSDERCASVLRDGTFQTSTYRENTYFRNIIYSRFLSSTYEQSKTDRALGFGVPVGEIVLGGDYSEAQFKAKKEQIERTSFNRVDYANEIDVALMSGDSTIVDAWSECMRDAGGRLALRMKALSPTRVIGELSWHPGRAGQPTGVVSTRLRNAISVPAGVTVVDGADCLKKKKKISEEPCIVSLEFKEPKQDLLLTANAQHGATYAYVAPRMIHRRETRNYPFTSAQKLHQYARNGFTEPSTTVALTPEEIGQGWHFDPGSVDVSIVVDWNERWTNRCDKLRKDIKLHSLFYQYRAWGEWKNRDDRKKGIQCHVEPRATVIRDLWLPDDRAAPKLLPPPLVE